MTFDEPLDWGGFQLMVGLDGYEVLTMDITLSYDVLSKTVMVGPS